MVNFEYRRFGLLFRQIMFSRPLSDLPNNEDVCIYHGGENNNYKDNPSLKNNKSIRINHQYTLLTNLEDDEEEIFQKFKKNCKYEIRRAQRENIHADYFQGSEASKNAKLLNSFEKTYNNMFIKKKMRNRLNRIYVEKALENNSMIISIAYYGNSNLPIVYHSYVKDNNNALLLYSASILWNDENIDSKIIGWANKYLHWQDMCYFKKNGLSRYEWGGLKDVNNPNGIDKFKMEFGGDLKIYDNCIIGKTIFGALYVSALKIKDKFKND